MGNAESSQWGCVGSGIGFAALVAMPWLLHVWRTGLPRNERTPVQLAAGVAFLVLYITLGGGMSVWMNTASVSHAMSVGFSWQGLLGVVASEARSRRGGPPDWPPALPPPES